MPVQLTKRARGQAHVHAGQVPGGWQFALGDLVRPAAALHAFRCQVEGVPECSRIAVIGERRHVGIGVLSEKRFVLRPRISRTWSGAPGFQFRPGLSQGVCSHKARACQCCRADKHPSRNSAASLFHLLPVASNLHVPSPSPLLESEKGFALHACFYQSDRKNRLAMPFRR